MRTRKLTGARRVRWILLSTAGVVSVLCVVIGRQELGPPADPRTVNCSSTWACTDPGSLYYSEVVIRRSSR